MPYRSDHTAGIARLLAEQGDAQARAAMESGRIWGGAVQNIGQNITGTLASLLQEKQDAPRRAMQDELGRLQLSAARREDAAAPQKELDAKAQRELAKDAQRAQAIAKGAGAILGLSPQEQGPAYAAFREHAIAGGLAPAEAIPPQYNPGWLRYKLREAQSIDALAKSLEPKAPIEVSAGASLFDPEKGSSVFTAPKPETAAAVGSFEDYVKRTYGDNPTPAQIVEGRKVYQQADDRPINIRTDLTPNAQLDATLKLRDRFTRETAAAQTVKMQLDLMKSSLAAVKAGAAAPGSQGVLVTFQKILDPTSVVRESEYARSASGLSLLSRIDGKWQTIEKGGAGVPVKDLEEFVALGEQFMRNQAKAANETKTQIDSIAKQYKLDPSQITRDIGGVSGTVRMRAPNGQEADVPADQVEAAKGKGATVIQ